MTRFALLLSLLAVGALGLVACDDDGETATTEPEVITSAFGAGGRVAGPNAPDACGDYHGKRPGGFHVRIELLEGVLRCREALRVLTNRYRGSHYQPPWSCGGESDALVECEKPGVAFAGHLYCPESPTGALCRRVEAGQGGRVDAAGGPYACGDYHRKGPGGYRMRIDAFEGVLRCREAQLVLKNYYRGRNTPPWYCADQGDALVECAKPGVAFAGQMYCRVWTEKGACMRRFGPP